MEAKDKKIEELVTVTRRGGDKKCQHKFKSVLANNSYAPFNHFNTPNAEEENSSEHPYESEIKALLEKLHLDDDDVVQFSNGGAMPDMMMNHDDAYVWVDNEEKLKHLVEVLSNQSVFAVDTEQHNLHSFLGFTALIQISTRDNQDYLVDTIALHDVMGILLRPVFADPNICKVFHGADNDVKWLQRDFHIYAVNLFDTAKACDVLSKPHRSLAYLLETYCGVITNKFYQRADWRQRPLPKDMLEYARMDAHYLLYIADCLVAELKLQKNENPASLDDDFVYEARRRSNAMCLQLFTKELEASPGQSAASSIISRHLGSCIDNDQFQGIVRRLCCWRDFMARMHDESLKYVLSDNAIVALAEKVPLTEADISTTISHADTTGSPSSVVLSHLADFRFLLQGELQNPDEILQVYIKKHLGPNGSCPLSLYNYGLVSKSNFDVPNRLVSIENGYKKVARKASRDQLPADHNCRIYANDGRLLCYCHRKKLEWYLQRDLAKLVDADPPAIMLLFESKGQPEIEGKKNILCVLCNAETKNKKNFRLRYSIIPTCYNNHIPRHLRSPHDILLLCVDCHTKATSFAEEYKKKIASDYGVPLFVQGVVNSSGGVSPRKLRKAVLALLRQKPLSPQRREELTQVVRTYFGGPEISDEDLRNALLAGMRLYEMRDSSSRNTVSVTPALNSDLEDGADESKNEINELENGCMLYSDTTYFEPADASAKQQNGSVNISAGAVIATCTKLLLLGHEPHGKQVVDYLLKEHGEDGIREFCQKWRQVFVEAMNPRFLSATGWDVTHSGRREFGDLSIYNPGNKGSPSAAKDMTVLKK